MTTGPTIGLGMPAPPAPTLAPRRKTRQLMVGNVGIGSDHPVAVSSAICCSVALTSCGRAQVDVYTLANEVSAGLEGMEVPLRVAVMGCVVNGPGEAREADLGVASGNGKGQIFVKGEVIKTVPEAQIVETLIEEAMRIASEKESERGSDDPSGTPVVTVS